MKRLLKLIEVSFLLMWRDPLSMPRTMVRSHSLHLFFKKLESTFFFPIKQNYEETGTQ